MKNLLSLCFCCFLTARLCAQSVYDVRFSFTYPTCNDANGGFTISNYDGTPVQAFIKVYRMPDSVLIGNGPSYSGLQAGAYHAVFEYPDYIHEWPVFLTNFKPLAYDSSFIYNFIQSVSPDTCSLGKAHFKWGKAWSQPAELQAYRDTLSLINWTWSNGQTGLDVTGLRAGIPYWVKGSFGNGCRYLLRPFTLDEPNRMSVFVHEDTLFFKVHNANTLDVGFSYKKKPLCNTPTGKLTAITYNTGTPPLVWKWDDGRTTPTVDSLKKGYHSVRVTDALGCEGFDAYFLNDSIPPGYTFTITALKPDSCRYGIGKAAIAISGGFPPYTFRIGGTPVVPTDLIIDSLPNGYQWCTVTDALGCVNSGSVLIQDATTLRANPVVTPPDCNGTLGKIDLNVTGGTPPLSYHWAGYPEQTTSVFDSLGPGSVGWMVADANNCQTTDVRYLSVPNSCYRSLKLSVFRDDNGNCENNTEPKIYRNPFSYKVLNTTYFSTQNEEDYGFQVLPGLQTIRFLPKPFFNPSCLDPDWNLDNLVVDPSSQTNEKAVGLSATSPVEKNLLSNLYVSYNSGFRPGFVTQMNLDLENNGNQLTDHTFLELTLPENVSFINSSLAHTLLTPNRIRMAVPQLGLGEHISSMLQIKVDASVPLHVDMPIEVKLDVMPGETKPGDNTRTFVFKTIGSYDPNDITVSPEPVIAPDKTELEYRIRFQNLGTFYAENVVLKDTLPAEVDPNSLRPVRASHSYSVELTGRVLTVRFLNIYLQAAVVDEKRSHGEFVFRIHRYPGLALGTHIYNSASVYFDFNSPVKTNTSEVEVNEIVTGIAPVSIYPNPGNEYINIQGFNGEDVELYDLTGKHMGRLKKNDGGAFSLSGISSGIYLITMPTSQGWKTTKLVVSKR